MQLLAINLARMLETPPSGESLCEYLQLQYMSRPLDYRKRDMKHGPSSDVCRYDHGCEAITNLDFSKPVIASMMRRNLRLRPKMRWKVGDMTDLKVRHTSGKLGHK